MDIKRCMVMGHCPLPMNSLWADVQFQLPAISEPRLIRGDEEAVRTKESPNMEAICFFPCLVCTEVHGQLEVEV